MGIKRGCYMKNETILKKAISKAVKNGWVPKIQYKLNPEFYRNAIIFSHDFAKKLWGKKSVCSCCGKVEWSKDWAVIEVWKYHLQQMVISDDPIKYLEKNL